MTLQEVYDNIDTYDEVRKGALLATKGNPDELAIVKAIIGQEVEDGSN